MVPSEGRLLLYQGASKSPGRFRVRFSLHRLANKIIQVHKCLMVPSEGRPLLYQGASKYPGRSRVRFPLHRIANKIIQVHSVSWYPQRGDHFFIRGALKSPGRFRVRFSLHRLANKIIQVHSVSWYPAWVSYRWNLQCTFISGVIDVERGDSGKWRPSWSCLKCQQWRYQEGKAPVSSSIIE